MFMLVLHNDASISRTYMTNVNVAEIWSRWAQCKAEKRAAWRGSSTICLIPFLPFQERTCFQWYSPLAKIFGRDLACSDGTPDRQPSADNQNCMCPPKMLMENKSLLILCRAPFCFYHCLHSTRHAINQIVQGHFGVLTPLLPHHGF